MIYVFFGIITALLLCVGGFYLLYKYKNLPPKPDYYEYYKNQDTVPKGKVGVFATALIMTEDHSHAMFHNIVYKIFNKVVPWPFRKFAFIDKGIALYEPERLLEAKEFTPRRLVDVYGNERDCDGYPYIDKYKQGQVVWEPPSKRTWLDNGYFIYKGRKSGSPTLCGKLAGKSRHYYYGFGIKQKKIPHWQGSFDFINGAFEKIQARYPEVMLRAESSLLHYECREKIHELLDAGCDTIVLAAPMGIYSHFEEFNGGFRHAFEDIEKWEKAHPGKKIKKIIAPQMGNFQPLRQAFLEMLKDRLDGLPENSDVKVCVTVHGMPWDFFDWEAWLELAPHYRDKLAEECRELVETYQFNRTQVVVCQDEFSNPIWDPEEKYLSTNRAYWEGVKDGYDYVIGLPIEFFAENTDTLMHHAQENYEGFDNYDVYEPIDYPDWSVPYTREIKQGKTTVIYNGVPVGKYQKHVSEAFYMAIDDILSRKAG